MKIRSIVATFLLLLVWFAVAGREVSATSTAPPALPAVVMLMRHAEKPEGDKSDPNLTATGYQRASLLSKLFNAGPDALPRPQVIFAADTSKHSNRSIETVTPLAEALHLPIDHEFSEDNDADLAKKLMSGAYAGKVVLVAWHHGELQRFAQELGVTDAPKWHDDTYDLIWKIEWVDGAAKLKVIHEQLLPGDSH